MSKKGNGNVTYRELIQKARDFADYFIDNVRTQNEEGGYEYDTAFFMDNQEDLKKVTNRVKDLLGKFKNWDNQSDEILHHVSVLESISKDLDECLLDYKQWMMSGTSNIEKPEEQKQNTNNTDDYESQEEAEDEGKTKPVVDKIAEALAKRTRPGREWMLTCDGESWLFAAQSPAEINKYISEALASLPFEPKEVRLFKVKYEEIKLRETKSYKLELGE